MELSEGEEDSTWDHHPHQNHHYHYHHHDHDHDDLKVDLSDGEGDGAEDAMGKKGEDGRRKVAEFEL